MADDSPTNVFVLTAMLKSPGSPPSPRPTARRRSRWERPSAARRDLHGRADAADGRHAAEVVIRAAQEPGARVVIVAVTAHPEVRHQPAFKAVGFDDVMMKPVDLAQLRHAVEKWMAGPDDRAWGATRGLLDFRGGPPT